MQKQVKLQKLKKLISNMAPVSIASLKVESAKKELKKGKDTRIQAEKSDEEFKML